MRFCEETFEELAKNNPNILVKLIIQKKISSEDLTFAAEALGQIQDSNKVRATLLPLLNHNSPIVREGAIYGLANHINNDVKLKLEYIIKNDNSKGVKQTAIDILENYKQQ